VQTGINKFLGLSLVQILYGRPQNVPQLDDGPRQVGLHLALPLVCLFNLEFRVQNIQSILLP
jgi:hypothetical protein